MYIFEHNLYIGDVKVSSKGRCLGLLPGGGVKRVGACVLRRILASCYGGRRRRRFHQSVIVSILSNHVFAFTFKGRVIARNAL